MAEVETFIMERASSLGVVLPPVASASGGRPLHRGIGADEDADFQARQRATKQTAAAAVGNPTFYLTIMTAHAARSPLDLFLLWCDKTVKRYSKCCAVAKENEET